MPSLANIDQCIMTCKLEPKITISQSVFFGTEWYKVQHFQYHDPCDSIQDCGTTYSVHRVSFIGIGCLIVHVAQNMRGQHRLAILYSKQETLRRTHKHNVQRTLMYLLEN